MLNNINKNIKNIIRHFPQKILAVTTKSVTYLGLTIYWCIILGSTILNIN